MSDPTVSPSSHGAPASTNVVVPLGPASWTIPFAISKFKELIKDPEVFTRGQFVWQMKLRQELSDRYQTLVAGDAATAAVLTGIDGTSDAGSLLDQLLEQAVGRAHADLATACDSAAKKLNAIPAASRGPNFASLSRMFTATSGKHGAAGQFYDTVEALFTTGKRFRKGDVQSTDPEDKADATNFATYFGEETMLAFRIVESLGQTCADKCGSMVDHVNAHIDNRTGGKGPRRIKVRGQVSALPMAPGASIVNMRTTPGAGDIVTYGKTLGGSTGDGRKDGAIWAARTNLDRGLCVAAHVVSGINNSGGAGLGLEHWLLLLAYEEKPWGFQFGFWDSDAATSTREVFGRGFGFLQYVNTASAATRGGAGGLGSTYPNGRFTTESQTNGVLCTNGDGVHIGAPGGVPDNQHRYQVGTMVGYASP